MFQKTLLIAALAAAACTVQAQTTPAAGSGSAAKHEYVARILKVQQPGIELLARNLVEQPALEMLDRAGAALPQRVPADKREAVARDIQSDARKYVDETMPLVRDRALKLAPTTVGALLEEKFTEDELKQIATMMENPAFAKFQAMGGDMQRALVEKLVADTRPQVEPHVRALEDTIAKRLGIDGGPAPAAPAGKAPSKKK
jgi:hypothetical protein